MLKTDLFKLVNYSRNYNGLPALSTEEYIKVLSTLEVQGFVLTQGNNIEVIKEYKRGVL